MMFLKVLSVDPEYKNSWGFMGLSQPSLIDSEFREVGNLFQTPHATQCTVTYEKC